MKEEKSLGTIIKEARKTKKLSQSALAITLNTTQQSVTNWEKDKNKPDISIIRQLCETLELNYINIKEEYYSKKDNSNSSKKSLKLKKRIILISLISILIICPIIMCLFIFNRNKIYIYYGNIDSDIIMSETLFIETYDQYILKLGSIISEPDNYNKIRIYYHTKGEDTTIAESNYNHNIYVIQKKKNSNIRNEFKTENIYIDIYSKKGNIYTSKITFRNLYTYDGIFSSQVGAYY